MYINKQYVLYKRQRETTQVIVTHCNPVFSAKPFRLVQNWIRSEITSSLPRVASHLNKENIRFHCTDLSVKLEETELRYFSGYMYKYYEDNK